ncbi:MAG: signal peptidase I [Clostridia bacterium]|nr:signal peptidase I [Clostridia bacterium]
MEKRRFFILEILIIGIVVFFISTFLFQICFVKGNSMLPTFSDGQVLVARKIAINIRNNDVVIIKKDNKVIIKRVIGIPNDKIKFENGYVCVNGIRFDERYVKEFGNITEEITLKENQYFVLGDNRNESVDSRFDEIGIIDRNEIVGLII